MSDTSTHRVKADIALRNANTASRNGDIPGALAAAQRATTLDPSHVEAWFVLGNAAMSQGLFKDAEQAFAEGAQHVPANTPTHTQLLIMRAQALISLGRTTEAVTTLRKAIRIGISDPRGLTLAGIILTQAGLAAEAKPLLLRATQLAPHSAEAWFSLGGTLQFTGDMTGAEAAYEAAAQAGQRSGGHVMLAHMSLANLKRWTVDNNHIARLEAMQCRHALDAACVAYALFKEYDDTGDTETAWDALQHGAMIGKSLDPWSAAEEEANLKAWQDAFPPVRFAQADTPPRTGPRRIFIVGLPRSGTTLIERILAAHSQVQAVGELKTFGLAVKQLSGSTTAPLFDADTIRKALKLDPLELAEAYRRETDYLSDGSAYMLDKLPRNHDYLGLIKLAFPDAILIDVRRNPMDSLFGAYKLFFSHAHTWSYNQQDLADHYDQYRRLMDYWRTCLPDLITLSLEALIADPETEIRRLLDLCGLPFEEASLSPHEAKGAVATASSAQVRKPINAEGIGAWKRYATQLEPLHQRLSDMGYLT
jgi:Flp pilus assembly protein TadD